LMAMPASRDARAFQRRQYSESKDVSDLKDTRGVDCMWRSYR
jgi:hypothetical protein